MEKTKNRGKNTGFRNLKPWKKGECPNPNGRPKGQRNYATIYREAIIEIANKRRTTPEAIEVEMVANAIKFAGKGAFNFYKDIMDRIHGTAPQEVDPEHSWIRDLSDKELDELIAKNMAKFNKTD